MYLWPPPYEDGELAIMHHRFNMDVILPVCTGLTSLLIAPKEAPFCLYLESMSSLRRLTVHLAFLFKSYTAGFAHELFRHITHFEVFDTPNPTIPWAKLALIPNLTHFSFWEQTFLDRIAGTILAECPRLQYLVFISASPVLDTSATPACERLAADPRFVAVIVEDFEYDWMRGALIGEDYWARAEAFVTAKQIGQVGSESQFSPSPGINFNGSSQGPNTRSPMNL
ncbi:hypothetical protein FB451DRAFT_69563 [Mycena latifolia]|nr:hypothetical protein FB451DRAFT_69563 [Mycena latifolia]